MRIAVSGKGQALAFECPPGEKVLLAGLASGIALPYECATGTCGTCKARLLEGEADSEWPEAPGHKGLKLDQGELLMCQCVARGDLALEVSRAIAPIPAGAVVPGALSGMIRRVAPLTHDVVRIDVEPARPVRFEAGQFMLLTIAGVRGARAYSMVNWASDAERLHFVVKKKPGGAFSEWLFAGDVAGAPVDLFGPLGAATFHPEADAGRHVLAIAGGSGVAGMMSILARAVGARYFDRHAGYLFFGVRTPRDVFFLDELAALCAEAGAGLQVTVALSDDEVDPSLAERYPGLSFARGFVHRVAGDAMKGRYERVRAYAAGPPVMVDATLRMLLVEGRLRAGDIRYDKFS